MSAPLPPHAEPAERVAAGLAVSPETGLDAAEVARRRRRYGENVLREAPRKSPWRILLDQFKAVMVYLLAAAALVSFAFAHWVEAAAIVVVLAINGAIGFLTELRAVRSMEALRRIAQVTARVRRDGAVCEVPARALVPGDIVLLDGGDVVPADLRLVRASKLQCDEALLTGESVPVAKDTPAVAADAPLAEQTGMAFKGTAVTRGTGAGVVVATGMHTQLGRVAALVATAHPEATPLERRLARLSSQLVWGTIVLTAVIVGIGLTGGKDALLMIQTGIALAVAAVPESLPVVATMVLARGMWRMARRNALIERLPAVETLGATTVICTDKTGTLTENRMTVTRILLPDADIEVSAGESPFLRDGRPVDPRKDRALRHLLEICVLCNNAALPDGAEAAASGEAAAGAVGDPMEVALLVAGAKAGLRRPELAAAMPELREVAFDPDMRMMATIHRAAEGCRVAVKGAFEPVLDHVTRVAAGEDAGTRPMTEADRRTWQARHDALAEAGTRVLAVAGRLSDRPDADPYADLVLAGLIGLADPPRRDVPAAIAACRSAGIRVVMVTGDHLQTARYIARAVGIVEEGAETAIEGREVTASPSPAARERLMRTSVLARVSPKQKLDLITLYQRAGEVVAMTGDGVNDAPALKKADIGIAMGRRGSQVAREAADMVLADDAFASIVAAIAQGRVIFGNIRKFVLYLLSCNLSEILVVGIATLSGMPLPLLPLQILYINLVTDVFPALALGACEGEPDIMRRPPRPGRESILATRHWVAVLAGGVAITVATLGAFVAARALLGPSDGEPVTVSFLTLALAQLWHVFNIRDLGARPIANEVVRNPYIWGALVLCVGLLLAAAYLPGLSHVLRLAPPSAAGWILVLAASVVPLVLGQLVLAALGAGAGPFARAENSVKPRPPRGART